MASLHPRAAPLPRTPPPPSPPTPRAWPVGAQRSVHQRPISRARGSRVDCDPQGAVGGGGAPRPTIPQRPPVEHRADGTAGATEHGERSTGCGTTTQQPSTEHPAPGTEHRARRPPRRRRGAANRGRRHVDPRPEAAEAHTRHIRGPRHRALDASRHRAGDPPFAPHHRMPHAPGHPCPARVWSRAPRAPPTPARRATSSRSRQAGPAGLVPGAQPTGLPTAPGARRPPSRRVTRCRPGPGLRGRRPASRHGAGRGAASRRVRRRRFGPLLVRERAHAGDGGRIPHPCPGGGTRHNNKIPPPNTLRQDALRRPDQDAREAGPVRDRPLVGS